MEEEDSEEEEERTSDEDKTVVEKTSVEELEGIERGGMEDELIPDSGIEEVDIVPLGGLGELLERKAVGGETGILFVVVKVWMKVVVVVIVERTKLGVGQIPFEGVMEGVGVVRTPVQLPPLHGDVGVGVVPGSESVNVSYIVEPVVMDRGVEITMGGMVG